MKKGKYRLIKRWLLFSMLVLPASTNYKLEGFSLGNAGGNSIGSSNYEMNANLGEVGNGKLSGNSYDLGAGLMFAQQANVPGVSLDNPSDFYNRLHLVINSQNNPSDAQFAVAISDDNFVTTKYVKSDLTIGTSLTTTDYQTYTGWGGAAGVTINGLDSGKTYKVKARARQGKFTETDWGPIAQAATVNPTLVFDIDVAPTDVQTTGPYMINLSDLNPGSLVTSTDKVWVTLETNAGGGGRVYIYGKNAGLSSTSAGYTITTVSGDLGTLNNGFGIQGVGATAGSGGPFTIDQLYNLNANNVGQVDTLIRQIFVTNNPISTGRGSFVIKAKSDNSTPAAADYTEIFTVIAAANY